MHILFSDVLSYITALQVLRDGYSSPPVHVLRHGDAEDLPFLQLRKGGQERKSIATHSGNSRSFNHRLASSLYGTVFGDRLLAHLHQGPSMHFQ